MNAVTDREQELLNIGEALRRKHGHAAKGYFCRMNENVTSLPFGSISTLTTGAKVWSFEHHARLEGRAQLALQGYPPDAIPPQAEEADMTFFAGQGIALPCMGSLEMSPFLNSNSPLWGKLPNADSEVVSKRRSR